MTEPHPDQSTASPIKPPDADRRMRITLAVIAVIPLLMAAGLAVHRLLIS